MGEFFCSWRRKVGCVTLIIALVLLGGWQRSRKWDDVIRLRPGRYWHVVRAVHSRIEWLEFRSEKVSFDKFWTHDRATPLRKATASEGDVRDFSGPLWGQHLDVIFAELKYHESIRKWTLPYWALTIPMTLLSACLLLWKPRKSKPSSSPQSQ